MLKRLARKPSTASLTPAITNSAKAISIWLEAIAQTMTGTSRMRPSVMMFGMFNVGRFPATGLIYAQIRPFAGVEPAVIYIVY